MSSLRPSLTILLLHTVILFSQLANGADKADVSAHKSLDPSARTKANLTIVPGQCIDENLGPPDETLDDGSYIDAYFLDWPGGDLRIVHRSKELDAYLFVFEPPDHLTGRRTVVDDPIDARKPEVFFLPDALPGNYTILANSYQVETGSYTICVSATSCSNVLLSDSFDRPDADRCELGQLDLAFGGSGSHYYLPLWPGGGVDPANPIGADIAGWILGPTHPSELHNNGLDFGGVQVTTLPNSCNNTSIRGENLGQNLKIHMDVLVPGGGAGIITRAGPYFRSRAAARGDGLYGGQNSGYWVQLLGPAIEHRTSAG
jgi:hypothetical protein